MSCSTHQRIPPSMWRPLEPTHEAGQTQLPAHRRKRVVTTYGMYSVTGEEAVAALVDKVAGHVLAGTLDDTDASALLSEELHEISHTYPEAFDDDVIDAVTADLRDRVS